MLTLASPPYHPRPRRPRRYDRWMVGCFVAAAVLTAGASALCAMALAIVTAPAGGQL
jgi:hypothetical protein